MLARLRQSAGEPVDAASIAAFRILFGTLMAVSAVRFLAEGWVTRCFVQPRHFFHYYGFSFVRVLPEPFMTAAFVTLAVLGLLVAIGLFYRVAIVLFFFLFTYVELIDVTNYLNHYYLVSLLAFLLMFVPANATFSLDARLGLTRASATVPRWCLGILRFQVGCVYVFAALAKMESDFLLHGQPVQIWMGANAHVPLVGPYLARHEVAVLLSWAGFLNDLLAVPLLLMRRTRPYAFAMILCFHAATGVFFNIGIFPVLMPINATLFFEPSWPRAVLDKLGVITRASTERRHAPLTTAGFVALWAFVILQIALPFRTHLYGRGVLWHEQGMRFSWRVMLRSKAGSITYRVRLPGVPRELEIAPRRYLSDHQEREFAAQPDLVLQLAHVIADDFAAKGHPGAEVRADALVSLNGRPAARMIDPDVDLARVEDGVGFAAYILPAPTTPPARF